MKSSLGIYARWIRHRLLDPTPYAESPVDIVSYPKSGRTWMRMMLGYVLCEKYGFDKSEILNTRSLAQQASLPPIDFSHAGTDISLNAKPLPVDHLTARVVIPFAKSRVILLIRDPRDVLVSSYFQATKRSDLYHADMSSFIRTDTLGIEKILRFYQLWYRYRWYPREFMLVRYEEIHADPEAVLRRVLNFISLEVPDRYVRSAIEYAQFDNMKLLEKQSAFNNFVLGAGDINDQESYKVRQGVVKGYTKYLSTEDIQYLDNRISLESSPFIQYYQ